MLNDMVYSRPPRNVQNDSNNYSELLKTFDINVESLSDRKYLNNDDAILHEITNNSNRILEIYLPSDPILGRRFIFIVTLESNFGFDLIFKERSQALIYPEYRHEVTWTGFKWLVL